jgi:small subunit ribosomal protein S7e
LQKGSKTAAKAEGAKPKKSGEVAKVTNLLKLKDPKKKATIVEEKLNTMMQAILQQKEIKEDLKDLKNLTFSSAKEIDVEGRKAFVLLVEPPLLAKFRALHKPLVEQLEKKLDATVLVMANRTMVDGSSWARGKKFNGVRPRNRTLKQVQEAMLEDLVFPCEIIGKRTKIQAADQSRRISIELSAREKSFVSEKTATIASVYKTLTSKVVDIAFPAEAGKH